MAWLFGFLLLFVGLFIVAVKLVIIFWVATLVVIPVVLGLLFSVIHPLVGLIVGVGVFVYSVRLNMRLLFPEEEALR